MRLGIVVIALFLTPNSTLANLSCQQVFLDQSNDLQEQTLKLQKELIQREVLTGPQVEALNKNFNEWLINFENKFKSVNSRMNEMGMSRTQRIETLQEIQSIYISFFTAINPIRENVKWRRILNRSDIHRPQNSFEALQDAVLSKELFSFYKDLLERTFEVKSEYADMRLYPPEKLEALLKDLKMKKKFSRIRDLSRQAFENVFDMIGTSLGIVSDSFPLRNGKLARADVIADMQKDLKPMDLMLDRAARIRLSHMILPGHYGHVAIYLGTKAQLIESGMWDHPGIVPHRWQIEAGFTVLEARRGGIRLRKLAQYINTDSITVIRQTNLTNEAAAEKMAQGLSKMGIPFDHTFSLEHSESFFCTKLVYFLFHDIPWQHRYYFGRVSFPPDHIAAQAIGMDRSLDPVLAYENGNRISEENLYRYVADSVGESK